MKNIFKNILALLVFITTLACESPVEDAALPYEPKLVVHGYLSPGLAANLIYIGSNRPVLGITNEYYNQQPHVMIKNIKVTITNSKGEKIEGNPTTNNMYQEYEFMFGKARLPIIKGETYTLNVTADNYPSVQATCTVPSNTLDIENTLLNIKRSKRDENNDVITANLKIPEENLKDSFYAYSGILSTIPKNSPNNIINQKQLEEMYISKEDVLLDRIQYKEDYVPNGTANDINFNFFLEISLSTVDENIYKYAKSVKSSSKNDDNPFAEPVQIYSNIKGGIGVFGAYLKHPSKIFELKN
ncbi:MAG: DUF4249 domain-containing protein [Pseudarcicella sp.]|nr:DUF4249 domain-containing protein [Pseudarcicella sp.]MBP6410751.1 DUF4249 domain-containing protein [Pseudarcicella sp.]